MKKLVWERKVVHHYIFSKGNFLSMKEALVKKYEKVITCTDEYRRHFFLQSIRSGRVGAFNQVFESPISTKSLNITKEEFQVFID